jgi:hypothetical protein
LQSTQANAAKPIFAKEPQTFAAPAVVFQFGFSAKHQHNQFYRAAKPTHHPIFQL